MTRRFLPVLAALVLLAGACGDDDDTSTDDAGTDDTAQTDDGAPEDTGAPEDDGAAAGDGGVTIADFAFGPATIEVEAGTAVTWSNEDGVAHTVTSGSESASDGTFDEPVEGGSSTEITFDEAGTFAYFCAIHPSMTGEVVVS